MHGECLCCIGASIITQILNMYTMLLLELEHIASIHKQNSSIYNNNLLSQYKYIEVVIV